MTAKDIMIIGGGHAGVEMAAALRKEGYAGTIRLICEQAELPYQRPPLSKSFLRSGQPPALLKPESFYRDNRIEICLGDKVLEIDRHGSNLVMAGGLGLEFSVLVFATGVRARCLRLRGSDLSGIYYLRTLEDADNLRSGLGDAENIAIIGGGFIGLEIAASLSGQGRRVTVFEAAGRLMERSVSALVSEHMLRRHQCSGTRILLNTAIRELVGDGDNRLCGLELVGGERVKADLAIVGIGTEMDAALGQMAGICSKNGLMTDNCLRAAPEIYAIGDCANYQYERLGCRLRLESVQNAMGHARHAARAIMGDIAPYADIPWFWSDQGETRLQMAGLCLAADKHIVSGSPEAFSVYNFCGEQLCSVDSVNHPGEHMLARRLLERGISPEQEQIMAGPEALRSLLG